MKIKITSDSTCDLTQELLDRFHIDTVPLYVIMDGVSYRDSVDITTEQIFAHVAAGGALCSTSAVSENDYIEFFTRELQDCDGLVHVTLSSKMSVCYQNACNAARRFEHVQVVDSLNLSSAQGLIVMEGAELAQDQTLDEVQIAQRLREIVPKVDGSFVLEDLEYLRKGGRCSTVAALGANLLKLKPCIEVVNGQMKVVKKYRGQFEKCIETYIKERLDGRADQLEGNEAFITHAVATNPIREVAWKTVREYGSFSEVFETVAGCTVCSHCGPNTLGVLFIRRESLKSET